jgi:DNA-binding response OmpR family regulator
MLTKELRPHRIALDERVGAAASTLRVLLIEDDEAVRSVIQRRFTLETIVVSEVADGDEALDAFHRVRPDVVVLDLLLPGKGGLVVLRELRQASDVPVILLSGLGDEADRVAGLELGADDYVVKPFSPRELLARVRSVVRRYHAHPVGERQRLVHDGLVIDLGARDVFVDDEPVLLTRLEFDLLAYLAASPRQTFSRGQILEHVWGSRSEWQDEATVTEHVHRLRQRLGGAGRPDRIMTVRGVGYRFEP